MKETTTTTMSSSMWSKFKSPFTRTRSGKLQKERENHNNLSSKLTVNEEYTEAFRTESYVEMWSKVQDRIGRISFDRLTSSSSLSVYVHLSEYLLEPQQETLMNMIETLHFHHLLIDYFESSLEAYNICELLLRSVHQTRATYRKIQRVIKLRQKDAIIRHLSMFASLKNPLSVINPMQFRTHHQSNMLLLRSLTSKGKKIRRRAKVNRLFKKIGGYSLIATHSAVIIAMLVFLIHGMVGIVAAPGLVACCLCLLKRRIKLVRRGCKTSVLERFGAQLDVAAKGVYILINDFNTMSRMVMRLQDEVDHRKAVARMCVRNGKTEILKEVIKEFNVHESSFLEQLKELEEHIHLCFLTINKSRRLVLQEITKPRK